MKVDIRTMEGLLRGKCLPAEYLVRQFDALHERAEAAERERDDLKQRLANAEHQLHMAELAKFNLRNQRKAQFRKRREAEAELARRDAAAAEPVGHVAYTGKGKYEFLCIKWPVSGTKLYTAAPPAVLPPKYADELKDRAELIEAYSKTQCEIAHELGCDSDNESILKAIYDLKEQGAQSAVLPTDWYFQLTFEIPGLDNMTP